MIKIETINQLTEPFPFSGTLAKRRSDLNRRIEDFNAAIRQYREQCNQLASAEDLDGNAVLVVRGRKAELLNQERSIRLEVADFYDQRESERSAFVTNANAEHEQLRERLKQRLADLGYSEEILPGMNQPSLTPDMVFRNPSVHESANRLRSYKSIGSDDAPLNRNRLAELDRDREEQRQRLRAQIGNLT